MEAEEGSSRLPQQGDVCRGGRMFRKVTARWVLQHMRSSKPCTSDILQ